MRGSRTSFGQYTKSIDDHNHLYRDQDDETVNIPPRNHPAFNRGDIRGLGLLAGSARYGYGREWDRVYYAIQDAQRKARSAYAKAYHGNPREAAEAYGRIVHARRPLRRLP